MNNETKFKVGQPVTVHFCGQIEKETIGYIDEYGNYYTSIFGNHYIINGIIEPRPTLLWSIREWFSSLRN